MLLEAKSGVELTQQLHVRGIEQIVDNEGRFIRFYMKQNNKAGW